MAYKKIDEEKLKILIKKGKGLGECARILGVYPSTVFRWKRKFGLVSPPIWDMAKTIAIKHADQYVKKSLNIIDQYEKDQGILNNLLDGVIRYLNGDKKAFITMQRKIKSKMVETGGGKKDDQKTPGDGGKKSRIEQRIETFDFSVDPRLLMIQIMKEIREHVYLKLEIFKTIGTAETVFEFQKAVLASIGEVAPEVRNLIINKLNEVHAVGALLLSSRRENTEGDIRDREDGGNDEDLGGNP
jgi:hypothetical protein